MTSSESLRKSKARSAPKSFRISSSMARACSVESIEFIEAILTAVNAESARSSFVTALLEELARLTVESEIVAPACRALLSPVLPAC